MSTSLGAITRIDAMIASDAKPIACPPGSVVWENRCSDRLTTAHEGG